MRYGPHGLRRSVRPGGPLQLSAVSHSPGAPPCAARWPYAAL